MESILICGLILLAALFACLMIAKATAKHPFRCKSCSQTFQPEWTKLMFALHADREYAIRCPYCGEKGCFDEADLKK